MPLAREEFFGPLSSAVFTCDLERGERFALRLEAGMAHVNDQPVNDLPNNPFGGEKNSGIGRFGGWAVEAFTTDQWVTVQHTPHPFPASARDVVGLQTPGPENPRAVVIVALSPALLSTIFRNLVRPPFGRDCDSARINLANTPCCYAANAHLMTLQSHTVH